MKSRLRRRAIVLSVSSVLIALATSCGSSLPSGTARTPAAQRDARVVAYDSMVSADMGVLNLDFSHKFTCMRRDLCVGQLQDIRDAASSFQRDLHNTQTPETISQPAANLKVAVQHFIDQADAALIAMQQAGSDYIHASNTVGINALNKAAAEVLCWPASVIADEAPESRTGYVCSGS